MEDMTDKAYPEALQRLLTELRHELNLLNTLNCNVHLYQGDFSIARDEAEKRTASAMDLYLAQLRIKVNPLFIELGKMVIKLDLVSFMELPQTLIDDADYASLARRWVQDKYSTWICW